MAESLFVCLSLETQEEGQFDFPVVFFFDLHSRQRECGSVALHLVYVFAACTYRVAFRLGENEWTYSTSVGGI